MSLYNGKIIILQSKLVCFIYKDRQSGMVDVAHNEITAWSTIAVHYVIYIRLYNLFLILHSLIKLKYIRVRFRQI